jgi:hypothetical protein
VVANATEARIAYPIVKFSCDFPRFAQVRFHDELVTSSQSAAAYRLFRSRDDQIGYIYIRLAQCTDHPISCSADFILPSVLAVSTPRQATPELRQILNGVGDSYPVPTSSETIGSDHIKISAKADHKHTITLLRHTVIVRMNQKVGGLETRRSRFSAPESQQVVAHSFQVAEDPIKNSGLLVLGRKQPPHIFHDEHCRIDSL